MELDLHGPTLVVEIQGSYASLIDVHPPLQCLFHVFENVLLLSSCFAVPRGLPVDKDVCVQKEEEEGLAEFPQDIQTSCSESPSEVWPPAPSSSHPVICLMNQSPAP